MSSEIPSTLYNGIPASASWPPETGCADHLQPMRVPYLERPPAVIPIDVGRQLFVDDFLLERRSFARVFHAPVKHPANPVLFPCTLWESNDRLPSATLAKAGGVWHDPADGLFKMWYMASYLGSFCLATSRDGVHWERPDLDVVPGTNLVLPGHIHPDSGTVWLDLDCPDAGARFKLFLREPDPAPRPDANGLMMVSPDGIHWSEPRLTGHMGDRSTCFWNPFRKRWVMSVRDYHYPHHRCRRYSEAADFFESGRWDKVRDLPFWTGADSLDRAEYTSPELYNLDAVAYESLMVGFFQILSGPPNNVGEATGEPKLTKLYLATSRDGFHWSRENRTPFIEPRREPDSWEYGYAEPSGGLFLVVGEELWFYYSAYAGQRERRGPDWHVNGMYGGGAMGLAKLRRDGFASLRGTFPGAFATTRPVVFSGCRLFVNALAVDPLRVEVQDVAGNPIAPFTAENCIAYHGNAVKTEIRWRGADDLSALRRRPVRFVFRMDRGDLFAFWVSANAAGASGGYLAAGGPGITATRDL